MTLEAEVAPEILGGRYRLQAPIGFGGMGRVFRAWDELLDRPVAVKLPDTTLFPTALEEARSAAHLNHPGVVQVFDVGVDGATGYIVMELVEGRSLQDMLREPRRLSPNRAADIAMQLADALDAAHRAGLVHCDVKPLNILVTPDGRTRLIDFGIACRVSDAAPDANDAVLGSAAYIAPERVRGEKVDARADVYALGAVLYEMLAGQPPFRGATATAVVAQRFAANPVPLRSIDPRVPIELEGVTMRALARDPRQRYVNAGEMRDALRTALHALSRKDSQRTDRLPRHQPRRAVAGVAVFMVICGLVLAGWNFSHRESPRVPTLVGHTPSEAPSLLEQAGMSASELTVLTRPVEDDYVGTIVDQQPQPGMTLDSTGTVEIAIGVPREATPAAIQQPDQPPPARAAAQAPARVPPGRAKKSR